MLRGIKTNEPWSYLCPLLLIHDFDAGLIKEFTFHLANPRQIPSGPAMKEICRVVINDLYFVPLVVTYPLL